MIPAMEIAVTDDTLYILPPSRYISVNVTPASWADTGQSLVGGQHGLRQPLHIM